MAGKRVDLSFAFDPDTSDMSSFTSPAVSGLNQIKELILPSSKIEYPETYMKMAYSTKEYRREFIIFPVQDHTMCNNTTNHYVQ